MFKNLREKISTTDSNSKNISGEQNLSRFSSISSLVSDVGSAFSKALTNPQHVQPMARNSKQFHDFDSVSEYDDSIVQGDTMSKEELFQRYQRAQALAKRYKTRSLEVVECYKRIEVENGKLTQTLTDSQDCNIRRVGELREQIELDKKAKNDIEENYQLMIDEKVELINVLRLQISLLKEGKDLPTEVESQIKEKHELEIQRQKKKDDEIKELRATMSQRENLLQRCKEKITTLNYQLNEFKMKNDNIVHTSIDGDAYGEQFSAELSRLSSQHANSLENIQKEHSERIRNMLCEFEEQKTILETRLCSEYGEKISIMEQELKTLHDKLIHMSQTNESLLEQVSIKTNIIQGLMASQDLQVSEIKKSSRETVENGNYFEISTQSFSQEINVSDDVLPTDDFKEQIKFLQCKIDQLETLKTQTEEETTKTENDLKNMEQTLQRERYDFEMKCNSLRSVSDEMKTELDSVTSRNEQLSMELGNLNSLLAKKKGELDEVLHERKEIEERYSVVEIELRKSNEDKYGTTLKLENLHKANEDLECQVQLLRENFGKETVKFQDQGVLFKKFQDEYDELNSVLEKETREKDKLVALLSGNDRITESPFNEQDGLMLKIVEMRQVYDNQIEEGKELIHNMELIISEKDTMLQELEIKIRDLSSQNDVMTGRLSEIESLKEGISNKYEILAKEFSEHKEKIDCGNKKNEQLLNNLNKELEEKDEIISELKTKHDCLLSLESKIKELEGAYEIKEKDFVGVRGENESLKAEIDQVKLQMMEYINAKESLEKECRVKDEQWKTVVDEEQSLRKSLDELQTLKEHTNEEKSRLDNKIMELYEEIGVLRRENSDLERVKEDYVQCKEAAEILQEKFNELNDSYTLLQKLKEEVNSKSDSDILILSECLRSTEEKLIHAMENKNLLERKSNIRKKYLNMFENWNANIISMIDSGSNCYVDNNGPLEYWNIDLEGGCEGLDDVISTGRYFDKVLKSWHMYHRKLHQTKVDASLATDAKNDEFLKVARELCILFDKKRQMDNEEDILDLLKTLVIEVQKRNDELIELDILLKSDEFREVERNDEKSMVSGLRSSIICKVSTLNNIIQEKDNSIKNIALEKENLRKRVEKITSDRIQHFKLLVKIFELPGMDFEDKNLAKQILKGLKEYAKRKEDLSIEFRDATTKVCDLQHQLKALAEESEVKDRQLDELRNTISEDGSNLLALRRELDQSVCRLNDFADEKGRIDEEKQSMRKELKELNEKIQVLKRDCEREMEDKIKIERHFDESLEKVKLNFQELEATYKKEIEKQCGYQHYLEEQINVSREESSRQLSENVKTTNVKLEEVLKQSEQLLVLNHQYKDLLDKSKKETTETMENLKQSEIKRAEIESEIEELRERNDVLISGSDTLTETYERVVRERDDFEQRLQSMVNEKEKEVLIALQSSMKDVESEKMKFFDQIKDLEKRNLAKNEELRLVTDLLDESKRECEDLRKDVEKAVQELEIEQKNYVAIKIEIEGKQSEIEELYKRNDLLVESSDSLKETYARILRERDDLEDTLQSVKTEKEKERETLVILQSSSKDCERERLEFFEQLKDLEEKNLVKDSELKTVSDLLDRSRCECEKLRKETEEAVKQWEIETKNYGAIKIELEEKWTEIQNQKDKIKSVKTKLKKLKTDHEKEVFEMKQQFNEYKANIDDDHNGRVKKLAREFNEKMLSKEQEFQRTFHEALENVRRDEARHRADFKDEIDVLNRMIIDLETEKNGLFNIISEKEDDLKKVNLMLHTKETQLEDLIVEVAGYQASITELETQLSKMKLLEEALQQQSKVNQIINTNTFYEDPSLDTVNANDHDVLQMHCADLEEQLRQLHQENINLKQSMANESHQSSMSPTAAHEQVVLASRSHGLASQPSLDNGSLKSTHIRSPNTSCSEYQFCPYPITEATEYEYLRDILVKYMTGLETSTLARVVCTVMRLSRDETDRIIRFEQDKRKLLQIQIFS